MRNLFALLFVTIIFNFYAKNTALIVGIGDYDLESTGWPKIHGDNDVKLLEQKFEDINFDVSTLINEEATKDNIIRALGNLMKNVETGDNIYIHFSGHGQPVEDINGDEPDGLDQSFICYDACFSSKYNLDGNAYLGQNHLIDDELFPYINELKNKVGVDGMVIIVFDSCYSGGADRGDIKDENNEDSEIQFLTITRGSSDEFRATKNVAEYLKHINTPELYNLQGGEVLVLSACPRDKKNFECQEKSSGLSFGSLSYCIGKMIDNGIPIDQWKEFFETKKFREYQIFRFSQKPIVETH